MNQLVNMQVLTMSSREIADMLKVRHDSVKRTIERLASETTSDTGEIVSPAVIALPPLVEASFSDSIGRIQKTTEYQIQKRDSFVVVAQLSPAFTAALVDRWQELENGKPAALPKSFADALRLAADQQEQIEQQAQQLAIAAPKVEFVDQYVEASGSMTFRDVSKLLGVKENLFSAFLLDNSIMYRLNGKLTAYQRHIDAGRFEVKTGKAKHNDHAFASSRFLPKGVEYVSRLLRDSKREPEKDLRHE